MHSKMHSPEEDRRTFKAYRAGQRLGVEFSLDQKLTALMAMHRLIDAYERRWKGKFKRFALIVLVFTQLLSK